MNDLSQNRQSQLPASFGVRLKAVARLSVAYLIGISALPLGRVVTLAAFDPDIASPAYGIAAGFIAFSAIWTLPFLLITVCLVTAFTESVLRHPIIWSVSVASLVSLLFQSIPLMPGLYYVAASFIAACVFSIWCVIFPLNRDTL